MNHIRFRLSVIVSSSFTVSIGDQGYDYILQIDNISHFGV